MTATTTGIGGGPSGAREEPRHRDALSELDFYLKEMHIATLLDEPIEAQRQAREVILWFEQRTRMAMHAARLTLLEAPARDMH